MTRTACESGRRMGTGTGMAVAGLLVVLVAPSAPGIVRAANPPATSGGDVFASGPKPGGSGGDAYDASACQDPQIAVLEQRRNVRAYRDTDGRVGIAAHALARELGDPSIDRGGACLHASGIVYLIPRAQDERFAAIALGHVARTYPSSMMLRVRGPEDIGPPDALTPIFHGSFDWHSCVHGYWLLARVQRAPAMGVHRWACHVSCPPSRWPRPARQAPQQQRKGRQQPLRQTDHRPPRPTPSKS